MAVGDDWWQCRKRAGIPRIRIPLPDRRFSTPEAALLPEFAARIGLDWADQKHFGRCSLATPTGHTPEAIEVWAAELAQHFVGQPVALALEQSRGADCHAFQQPCQLPQELFPLRSLSVIPSMRILSWIIWSGIRSNPRTAQAGGCHTASVQRLIHWLKQVSPQILRW